MRKARTPNRGAVSGTPSEPEALEGRRYHFPANLTAACLATCLPGWLPEVGEWLGG